MAMHFLRSARAPLRSCCRWLARGAALLLALGALPAHAVTTKIYCIGDSFQLADVLLNGNESQSVNLDIRLRQGTYTIDSTTASFIAPTTIRGGWSDANCTVRAPNPYNTVIDLSGGKLVIKQPKGLNRAALTIDGLTFKHGDNISLSAGTTNEIFNDPGDMTIRRTRFTNFSGATQVFATVDFFVATGTGKLENVLIDHIGAPNFPQCTVGLDTDGASANWGANYVTGDFGGSVCLATGPSYYVTNVYTITNSIFWNSQGGPPNVITLLSNNAATVYVNIRTTLLHEYRDYESNVQPFAEQVDADPKWIAPASGSYGLGPSSPAIDVGFAQSNLGLPSNDMIGQARLIGPNPDLGALESNGSTLPTYIVSNTNDMGGGSLRQAMLDANGSGKALVEIIFQLPGGCPQVIALNSALPDITTGMRIEGYSQAGSKPNGDPNFFDATLCVLIKPASGTLNNAFKVPASALNGQLTLNGVGLGGFGTPISLGAGPVHKITGIQIGGNVLGVDLPGPGLNGIFVSLSGVYGIIIGGDTPAEMNVIGGAASNGIDISAGSKANPDLCQIVGNLIGVSQNGSTRLPNDWGINLAGSNCRVRNNRVAGNYYDQIWLNGGSNNVVQGNQIGYALDDSGWLNSSAGVLITGGSNNVVGAPFNQTITPGSVLANTIRYAGKGGVIVKYASAAGNSIRGNVVRDVGGPAIDLNDDGPTANDALDTDTGPNQLQNFATVTAIQFKNAIPPVGALNVQAYVFGELTGGTAALNKVDAYFYNGSCGAGTRGQAQYYLGSYPAFTFANGTPSQFNYLMTLPNFNGDGAIAFTATDPSGNTSEIGTCFNVQQATLVNNLFKDSYE